MPNGNRIKGEVPTTPTLTAMCAYAIKKDAESKSFSTFPFCI